LDEVFNRYVINGDTKRARISALSLANNFRIVALGRANVGNEFGMAKPAGQRTAARKPANGNLLREQDRWNATVQAHPKRFCQDLRYSNASLNNR